MINPDNEIYIIIPAHAETYDIILASFSIKYSLENIWFFEEIFLLADTNIEVVMKMSFLTFNNIETEFKELNKRI